MNILDVRLKSMEVESKKFSTSEISDGDFEGEWTAKNKRKKFKRRQKCGTKTTLKTT